MSHYKLCIDKSRNHIVYKDGELLKNLIGFHSGFNSPFFLSNVYFFHVGCPMQKKRVCIAKIVMNHIIV